MGRVEEREESGWVVREHPSATLARESRLQVLRKRGFLS
jgi:hypothetical protein